MEEAFFRQIKRNIESLIAEGDLTEAYLKCKEMLEKYPNRKGIEDLKRTIERRMIAENKELVKVGLREVKAFEKNGEREKALKKLKELLLLMPNDEGLKRLYLKIQKKYKNDLEKEENVFIKKRDEVMNTLFESDDIEKLMKSIATLSMEYKDNAKIKALVKKYRGKIIEKEIKKKKELLNSNKFDDIESFIENLKTIDDSSVTIKNIQKYILRRKMGHQVENIEEFIYSGEESLSTLMKLKKYEEAEGVAREILKTSPDNRKVKKILRKAGRKAFLLNQKEVVKTILKSFPKLKEDYKENKQDFIRI